MTNKELVQSIYPNAIVGKTFLGFNKSLTKPRFYIKHGDALISAGLFLTPKEAWTSAGKKIKRSMLEKLENAK